MGSYETTAQRNARRANRKAHDPEYAAHERERGRERARRSYARKRAAVPPVVQPRASSSTAAYYRAYRALHRERINAQQRVRKSSRRATDPLYRAAEQSRLLALRTTSSPPVDRTPVPAPYTGHPLLEQAREIAGAAWYGSYLYDPIREDAAGEAVLALCAGGDPRRAVQRFFDWHRRIRSHELPLYRQED